MSALVPHHASNNPKAPPTADSSTLSQQLPRNAPATGAQPGAHRNFFFREAARASSRLATLAQAISKTETHRAQQNEQRPANLPGELCA